MEFSRPEYWSGLLFPSPEDLPNPGIEPRSPALQADFFYHLRHQEAQEYWSGEPVSSPGDLSDPGIESSSPTLQADSLPAEPPGNPVIIINLSKSIECTAPRVRLNVNCRLWVIMTCQPRFMYCKKCVPQVGMLMVGGTWKISVHSPQFFCEPKNSLLKAYEGKKM